MFAVLDTNHFRVVAEGADAADVLDQRARKQEAEIFLSVITVQEATGGWLGLINGMTAGRAQVRAYASFQKTIAAFGKFDILPFDDDAAERFHALKKAFPNDGTMDLKIAAICLAHDMTLLTRDTGDFKDIPGLRVENWLD
ncbi:MAG: type II toxin-antitoxin system VapC family toxin [Verrucomicrobiaceae bacterium]|nr:type II toxin-antitoxin system VapC family toxin [Verrucomicrobiaceae bacterium]